MLNHFLKTEHQLEPIGLFEGLSDESSKRFLDQMVTRKIGKNEIVFLQEDEATSFYIVKKGWVKLYRETLNGEEAVIDILTTGHIFGETSLFEGDHYVVNAEAVEETELLCFSLATLKESIASDTTLSMNMLHAMSRFRHYQDMELEHRTVQNAPQRIGCFLLRLCKPDAPSPIRLNLPYDKTLIASRLGMKPETFSRGLNRLRDETNIRIQGATVEIDALSQLTSYSCSACSSAFPCADSH
jgi:CRP-like cAMP-binding protein